MPSTVVHAGFALLLVAAVLRTDLDRRVIGLVLVVLAVPEADSLAGWVLDGAHRSLLHTLVIPAVVAGLLYYDTRVRETSWLVGRFGTRGRSVAWAVLFVHVFAHLMLDYAHLEGVNLLYPVYDRFFRLEGEFYLSTTEGLVQTFVEVAPDPETGETSVDVGGGGTTEDTHVANPAQPDADVAPDESVERRFPIAVGGWQLYLVLVGLFTVAARRLQDDPGERSPDCPERDRVRDAGT